MSKKLKEAAGNTALGVATGTAAVGGAAVGINAASAVAASSAPIVATAAAPLVLPVAGAVAGNYAVGKVVEALSDSED